MGLPLERSKFIKWIEHKKIINKMGKLLSICKPTYYGQVFAIGGGIEKQPLTSRTLCYVGEEVGY